MNFYLIALLVFDNISGRINKKNIVHAICSTFYTTPIFDVKVDIYHYEIVVMIICVIKFQVLFEAQQLTSFDD